MAALVIFTPLLNNNEDVALVAAWLVKIGTFVEAGHPLVTLETTKVASDVEAVEAGFLRWCGGEVGAMVAVNSPIAILTKTPNEPFEVPHIKVIETAKAAKESHEKLEYSIPSSSNGADKKTLQAQGFEAIQVTSVNATLKAKILARRFGVDLNAIGVGRRVSSKDLRFALDALNVGYKTLSPDLNKLSDFTTALGVKSPSAVIIGDGPHARYVLDTVRRAGICNVVGFTSVTRSKGTLVNGLPVLGADSDLAEIFASGVRWAFIGVGSERSGMRSNQHRAEIFNELKSLGFTLPILVDPDASVSASALLGEGTLVAACAVVSANAHIGANCLVNIGCIVCHDAIVGNHVHLTPGAILAGSTQVGDLATIGMGATLLDGTKVGRKCLVLNNARVISDLPDGMTAGVAE